MINYSDSLLTATINYVIHERVARGQPWWTIDHADSHANSQLRATQTNPLVQESTTARPPEGHRGIIGNHPKTPLYGGDKRRHAPPELSRIRRLVEQRHPTPTVSPQSGQSWWIHGRFLGFWWDNHRILLHGIFKPFLHGFIEPFNGQP